MYNKVFWLPRWLSGKESTCQCRRRRFDPWVGKIPLEEEMAAHSSILARKMQWTEGSRGLHSMGSQSDTTEWLSAHTRAHTHTHTHTHTAVHFLIPGICNHVTLLGKQAYQLSLNEDSWVGEIILDNLGGFTIITSVLISEQVKVRGDVMRKAEVRQMTRRGYELWMQVLPETMKSKAIASLLESPEGRPPQQSILDISPLEW